MARPRKGLISLDGNPFYHVISRCLRRAFLSGEDDVSGHGFNYRCAWLLERMTMLSIGFAIDIYAYAIMSNHFHLVLYIDKEKSDNLSDE